MGLVSPLSRFADLNMEAVNVMVLDNSDNLRILPSSEGRRINKSTIPKLGIEKTVDVRCLSLSKILVILSGGNKIKSLWTNNASSDNLSPLEKKRKAESKRAKQRD